MNIDDTIINFNLKHTTRNKYYYLVIVAKVVKDLKEYKINIIPFITFTF